MTKIGKKGFTLVELLAVIVVLAIIMILAIPSVFKSMNDARKSSFKIYAQKAMNAAQGQYQSDVLLGTKVANIKVNGATDNNAYCYTLAKIGLTTAGTYKGYVVVVEDVNMNPNFYITLTDNSFSITSLKYAELEVWANYTSPITVDGCPSSITGTLS